MSQTFSGARAIFSINGNKLAYASDCNYTINHDVQEITVLDRINPLEHAEVGYSVSFSCNTFRVANQSAVKIGIAPKLEQILTQSELTAELIDRLTGKTLLRVIGVKMTSRSGGVSARGVATESWSFVGIKASDEAGD